MQTPAAMDLTETFEEMARACARAGGAAACAAEAAALDVRARPEPPERAEALHAAARGLRVAARILSQLEPAQRPAPFRPVGLRGALAAGHLALVEGRAAQAERIGEGVAEAAPRSGAGLRLVAEARLAQGRFLPALQAVRGALAVEPDDPYTRALHAEALWFAGERIGARAELAALRLGGPHPLAAALEAALGAGALDGAGAGPPERAAIPARRGARRSAAPGGREP